MLNIGIAGLGFMGMIHYLAYQRVRGARVAAICEQDPTRLAGDWRSIKGNFGPEGQVMDLGNIARYARLDDLLADPKIDMVDVCLPPSYHAGVSIEASRAGKHVFCEKPIALKPEDADSMVEAAQAAGKLLFIGHVLPFFPEYRFAYEAITSRQYGRMIGGYFRRIISDPQWLPDFYNPNSTGGPMIDLHIHDAHFIRLVCGMPRAVTTVGRMRGEVAELFQTQFLFDDPGLAVAAACGAIQQQGRPFTHAFEIYLEKATLLYDFATLGKDSQLLPLTVLTADGGVHRPQLGSGDPVEAFVGELTEAVGAVEKGVPSALLKGDLARDALLLGQRQTQSLIENRTVEV
jgi:predicted dehydrogenase